MPGPCDQNQYQSGIPGLLSPRDQRPAAHTRWRLIYFPSGELNQTIPSPARQASICSARLRPRLSVGHGPYSRQVSKANQHGAVWPGRVRAGLTKLTAIGGYRVLNSDNFGQPLAQHHARRGWFHSAARASQPPLTGDTDDYCRSCGGSWPAILINDGQSTTTVSRGYKSAGIVIGFERSTQRKSVGTRFL